MVTKSHLNPSKYIFNLSDKSCLECVKEFIEKINKKKDLNIFIEVFEKESLIRAKEIDKKIKENSAGKLAGCVLAIKDNICYKNHEVTASSKILSNFKSIYSATVVERLLNEDAIIIGRLNCDEFAMGSTNENSVYGPVKNPLNPQNIPGGSSGGAAAAVAAGIGTIGHGTDIAGSIRYPAYACGIHGLRPSLGRVADHNFSGPDRFI